VSGSSSDGDSEKCPICLITLAAQEVGKPDTCDHLFCIGCIEEWAAKTNTCPVDRQVFNLILVRHYPDGEIRRTILVRRRRRLNRNRDFSLWDLTICVLCGERERQDRMISCRGCNFFHHLECLTPPLETMPSEEWFCPMCVAVSSSIEEF
jgi:PHD and RING finger domain-containing protein 1